MGQLSSAIALFLGMALILMNMVSDGHLNPVFFNLEGFLLVVGGTLIATMIQYPAIYSSCFVKSGFQALIYTRQQSHNVELIEQILELNRTTKRKGLLAIEPYINDVKNPYLQRSLNALLSLPGEKDLELFLTHESRSTHDRVLTCHEIYNTMAGYAPAFGMVGTVIGLILMMTQQAGADAADAVSQGSSTIAALLEGMGLALITTFYGVVFANLLFAPLAGKMKIMADHLEQDHRLIQTGIMAIKHDLTPSQTQEKLIGFISDKAVAELRGSNE